MENPSVWKPYRTLLSNAVQLLRLNRAAKPKVERNLGAMRRDRAVVFSLSEFRHKSGSTPSDVEAMLLRVCASACRSRGKGAGL
ncbi:hypothetical protein BaRGS_00022258 [Batillaria attramentaria]|uniref:Uncharacterized protein n=1 Tax=Batillaria attramentaria TaxID=370345 RepID=A0ABD0KHQ8_9CAEN